MWNAVHRKMNHFHHNTGKVKQTKLNKMSLYLNNLIIQR